MQRFAFASHGLLQRRLLCPQPIPPQAFVEIQTASPHYGRDRAQEGRTENVTTPVLQASPPKVEWWCTGRVRGYAASAIKADEQIPASEYYERATELIRQVEDATEVSGQRADDKDDLREKLEGAVECLEISLSESNSDPRVLLALYKLHQKYELRGRPADRIESDADAMLIVESILRGRINTLGLSFLYQAAEAGLADAQYELASRLRLQEIDTDPGGAQAGRLLKEAAAQGHQDAMFLLGAAEYSAQGRLLESNSPNNWFKQAADVGYVPAASIYGILLLKEMESNKSRVGTASKQEAEKYLEYAAEQGEPLAAEWLTRLENGP